MKGTSRQILWQEWKEEEAVAVNITKIRTMEEDRTNSKKKKKNSRKNIDKKKKKIFT
jgi:hypothetical protein